jgi:hypothetical protein
MDGGRIENSKKILGIKNSIRETTDRQVWRGYIREA